MSHLMETMAWTGEKPWHKLGKQVSNDLTPEQMMVASGCDWTVSQHPIFARINGVDQPLKETALVRDTDGKILSLVGEEGKWFPRQNKEAFSFFQEFTEATNMTMETAGSLKEGQIVWVLAKNAQNFTLFGGDHVESYTLMVNAHKYGWSNIAQFTATRVVCWNTLSSALNSKSGGNIFKATHRTEITNDMIKEALGLTEKKMTEFRETALFLGSKRFNIDDALDFFNDVFPSVSVKKAAKGEASRNATQAKHALTHQPGIEFAPGTWWQVFNAVTFVTDHFMGRDDEGRFFNSHLGQVKDLKQKSLKKAMEYATKS